MVVISMLITTIFYTHEKALIYPTNGVTRPSLGYVMLYCTHFC